MPSKTTWYSGYSAVLRTNENKKRVVITCVSHRIATVSPPKTAAYLAVVYLIFSSPLTSKRKECAPYRVVVYLIFYLCDNRFFEPYELMLKKKIAI